MLEIPVSVNNSNMLFGLYYQISSPKIVLELYVSRNGNITKPDFVLYSDHYKSGQWTDLYASVDSDVNAVVLHANKMGITRTFEYVLVDPMHIILDTLTGNISEIFSIGYILNFVLMYLSINSR